MYSMDENTSYLNPNAIESISNICNKYLVNKQFIYDQAAMRIY